MKLRQIPSCETEHQLINLSYNIFIRFDANDPYGRSVLIIKNTARVKVCSDLFLFYKKDSFMVCDVWNTRDRFNDLN